MSVNKERLRFSNVSEFRSSFGVNPELGVDERPRGDRISQGFLQREWDIRIHDQGRNVYYVQGFETSSAATGYTWFGRGCLPLASMRYLAGLLDIGRLG